MKNLKIKERLTSWATWLAVLGLVGLILNQFGILEHFGLDIGKWEIFVNAIGTVLCAFGIVNNPTDHEHF